jgi:hypothetical protein
MSSPSPWRRITPHALIPKRRKCRRHPPNHPAIDYIAAESPNQNNVVIDSDLRDSGNARARLVHKE